MPTKNLLELGVVEVAVPPLARGRIPLTSAVKETGPEVRSPAAEDLTTPYDRPLKVVEADAVKAPETFKVESRLAGPVT